MKKLFLIGSLSLAGLLVSCTKQDSSNAPHATVQMRDGTSITGSVTSSSPSEVVIAGDDKTSHTIPMSQVKAIVYDDAQASSSSPSASPAPTSARTPTATTHESHYHPAQSAVSTKTYRVAAGANISVRNEETIDSSKAAAGQTYAAEVTEDVRDANGDVVIPRGSNAKIVIKSSSKGGKIKGASDLVLDLQSVSIEGQEYELSTTDLSERGKDGVGANRRTAEYTGGGGAIGAIIGAIAGGGKGAAIGAGAGAGAGALTQVLTKGAIKVPAETVLTFKLDQPLRVVARQ